MNKQTEKNMNNETDKGIAQPNPDDTIAQPNLDGTAKRTTKTCDIQNRKTKRL